MKKILKKASHAMMNQAEVCSYGDHCLCLPVQMIQCQNNCKHMLHHVCQAEYERSIGFESKEERKWCFACSDFHAKKSKRAADKTVATPIEILKKPRIDIDGVEVSKPPSPHVDFVLNLGEEGFVDFVEIGL